MGIKIELGRNGTVKFESVNDAHAWLQEERQAWTWLNGLTGRFRDTSVAQRFQQGWSTLQVAIQKGDEEAIHQCLQELYNDDSKLILSQSPAGRFLRRIAENDPMVANAAAFYFVETKISDSNKKEIHFQVANIAWAVFSESISGLKSDLSSIRQSGKRLIVQLQEQSDSFTESQREVSEKGNNLLTNTRDENSSLSEELRNNYRTFLDQAKEEYNSLKEFYKTELALKAPVTYWATVATHHRWLAFAWGIIFTLLLLGLAFLVITSAKDISAFLTEIEKETIAIAFIIAIGTAVFWAMRMVAKIFLSNYHRAVDAAERETMVKTFLALRREGNITDEQLDLVLSPLFRPGATGLVREDSTPEYGIISKLSKELSKNK